MIYLSTKALTQAQIQILKRNCKGLASWTNTDYGSEIVKMHKDHEKYIKEKFSKKNLETLQDKEFSDIYKELWASHFWSNKDWHIENRLLAPNGIVKIRENLSKLLYGDGSIVKKYNEFKANVKGFGPSALSEILLFIFPDQYCLWNAKTQTVLSKLGLDILPKRFFKYQINTGEDYFECVQALGLIKDAMTNFGIRNFIYLDIMFIYMSQKYPNIRPIPLDLDNYYIIEHNTDHGLEALPEISYTHYGDDNSHIFDNRSNCIIISKIELQDYFIGYGQIEEMESWWQNDPLKDAIREISTVAKFSKYTEFPNKKIVTHSMYKKIHSMATSSSHSHTSPAVLQIPKELYDEIVNPKTNLKQRNPKPNLDTFENSKLEFPKKYFDHTKKEIQKDLLISDDVIDQIVFSLYSGKHVILTGPVGTGKTHLAKLIPKIIWQQSGGYYPETVTATSEWTTQDVVGGIFPKVNRSEITYAIQKGCVSDTVSKNWNDETGKSGKRQKFERDGITYNGVWLVIDEFNRANADRAFGPLFTALEYKRLKIPTTNQSESFEELTIPEDYRIIGTLNTFDKHFLFKLSDALKRRFSFIEILPPPFNKKDDEMRFVVKKALDGFDDIGNKFGIKTFDDLQRTPEIHGLLSDLYDIMAFIRLSKNLGTAVLIAIFRFTIIHYHKTGNADTSLDAGIVIQLLPHLESLQYWQIDSILNFVQGHIHEMFRKFDVHRRPDVDRYEGEFKNLITYMRNSGIKISANWINKFRAGEILDKPTEQIPEIDPWKNKTRPNLRKFRIALESLKKEKGYQWSGNLVE